MRLAILADIHGNLPALEAVLEDVAQQGVEGMIVAGDFVDRPQPLEAVRAVQALDACVIRGNREDYLLAYHGHHAPDHWRTSRQWIGVRWLHQRLDREALEFLASLPEQCVYTADGTAPIRVVHASPGSMSEAILPSHDPEVTAQYRHASLMDLRPGKQVTVDQALERFDEPVLICGHSHISWQAEQDSRLIVNPGSVGMPINQDTRAQYALLTWDEGRWQAVHQAVEYDLDRVKKAYRESGILAVEGAFALAQLRSIETAQNFPGWLVTHCRQCATEAGIPKTEAIPDTIWEQAIANFDWDAAVRRQSKHLPVPANREGEIA